MGVNLKHLFLANLKFKNSVISLPEITSVFSAIPRLVNPLLRVVVSWLPPLPNADSALGQTPTLHHQHLDHAY